MKRGRPGAFASKGCDALALRPTRNRVAAAGAAAVRGAVNSRAEVPPAAARPRRREASRSTPSTPPSTSPRQRAFNPSSMAQRTSAARVVSTMIREVGENPKAVRPSPCRWPCSAASAAGKHISSGGACPLLARLCRRRNARHNANPMAAGQSRCVAGLISCRAAGSRPCRGRQLSIAGSPKLQLSSLRRP